MTSAPRFYRDFGRPDVERLARAVCLEEGCDPDSMIKETGYSDAALMPRWWRYQADTLKFIAMMKAHKQEPSA